MVRTDNRDNVFDTRLNYSPRDVVIMLVPQTGLQPFQRSRASLCSPATVAPVCTRYAKAFAIPTRNSEWCAW